MIVMSPDLTLKPFWWLRKKRVTPELIVKSSVTLVLLVLVSVSEIVSAYELVKYTKKKNNLII